MTDSMTMAERVRRLRRHLFGKASLLALLPILIALIGSAALNFSYNRSLAQTREMVAHSLRVNTAINDLLSMMQDIETGQRGFLITGDDSYLGPYRKARAMIGQKMAHLERLVEDNPGQSARIGEARTISEGKIAEVDSTIAAMRTEGYSTARARVSSGEGKRSMDAFRAVIGRMRDTENALLEARVDAMHRTERWIFAVVLTGILLALSARLAAYLVQLRLRRRRRGASAP